MHRQLGKNKRPFLKRGSCFLPSNIEWWGHGGVSHRACVGTMAGVFISRPGLGSDHKMSSPPDLRHVAWARMDRTMGGEKWRWGGGREKASGQVRGWMGGACERANGARDDRPGDAISGGKAEGGIQVAKTLGKARGQLGDN